MTAAGAVTLERVAQDGMRVRASAGASSFRRQETLEAHLEDARAQVERLAQERERRGGAPTGSGCPLELLLYLVSSCAGMPARPNRSRAPAWCKP